MDNDVKDKKEQRRQYILTAPLMPLLVKMAIPTVIGMLVMILYNLTDTFFIAMFVMPCQEVSEGESIMRRRVLLLWRL